MSKIQENNAFQYTYSAGNQEEIKQIRSKYLPREENKLERLRKLDAGVTQKATMYSLIVGIIGMLRLGGGMSLCLTAGEMWMFLGIPIGIIGMAILSFAYPIYNRIIKTERKRIAPEILRLTDELMK